MVWYSGSSKAKTHSGTTFKQALEEMNLTFRLDDTSQNRHLNNFLTSLQQRVGHSVAAAVAIAAHAPQLVQIAGDTERGGAELADASALIASASASTVMGQVVAAGRAGMTRMEHELRGVSAAMQQLDEKVDVIAAGTEQIGMAVRTVNQDVQRVAHVAGELLNKSAQVRRHGEAVRGGSDKLLDGLGGFRINLHTDAQRMVEQLAAQTELSGKVDRAERTMQRALVLDKRFELLYLVGADGRQISENIAADDIEQTRADSRRGVDWSQRPWFRAVIERLHSYISPVYRSAATDAFCFTVSAPVFAADGRLLRVLGADVRLLALV